ncbi:hypothetical protein [Sunxiuqinia indica]|uniref:hypothetical protein n=1 Tax=Sunxiuqinia indica TaxID=2692584 RepID=UPI00135CA84C|nr:hypothetical protein [Sunxiuqinia indica]
MSKKWQIKNSLIVGLIIILVNLYWIWDNLYLLYQYHYTGNLFLFMIPDWALISNSVLGFVGVITGVLTAFEKLTIKKGILVSVLLIVIGTVMTFISLN